MKLIIGLAFAALMIPSIAKAMDTEAKIYQIIFKVTVVYVVP